MAIETEAHATLANYRIHVLFFGPNRRLSRRAESFFDRSTIIKCLETFFRAEFLTCIIIKWKKASPL